MARQRLAFLPTHQNLYPINSRDAGSQSLHQ